MTQKTHHAEPGDHEMLNQLFLAELQLQYRKDKARVTADNPRIGSYLGSGTGSAIGLIAGAIEWDLFEAQGQTVCAANFKGKINAGNGNVIHFDCLGFFRRPAETGKIWTMSGSVIFDAPDARFKRLTERPAVWEGEFDMNSYNHRYLVYRKSEKSEDARC